MLFKGVCMVMLTRLNRLSGIMSKLKPLRCLLNAGLTKMEPINRISGLAVDPGWVPFRNTKTKNKKSMVRTCNPKIPFKIMNHVRMHVGSTLGTANEHEINPSGMIPMEECGSPGSKAWHSNQLKFLNHLL